MADYIVFVLAVTLGTALVVMFVAYVGLTIDWIGNWLEDKYG